MKQVDSVKKQRLIHTAQRLFGRFVFKKTTIEEIIRLTRIAKGTFYKYFPNKEALFLEIVKEESANLISAIRKAVARSSNSQEKMKYYIATKVSKIIELVNFHQITRENIDEYWPHIEEVRENYLNEEQKIVHEIIINGISNGEFEVTNPELTAYVIVMTIEGLESSWRSKTSPMELGEAIELFLNILFRGLLKNKFQR